MSFRVEERKSYLLTDVVSLASRRAHILVAKEGDEVHVGALVFSRFAVDAGRWRPKSTVSVQIKGTGLVEGSPRSFFQLLQLSHCFGEGMAGEGGGGEAGGSEELHSVRWCVGRDLLRRS